MQDLRVLAELARELNQKFGGKTISNFQMVQEEPGPQNGHAYALRINIRFTDDTAIQIEYGETLYGDGHPRASLSIDENLVIDWL